MWKYLQECIPTPCDWSWADVWWDRFWHLFQAECICIAQFCVCQFCLFVFFLTEPEIPVSQVGKLSTTTIVGISIGVGSFVLIILVVCCCLYQRQKRQIDEYKQLYFLQQSDYQVGSDFKKNLKHTKSLGFTMSLKGFMGWQMSVHFFTASSFNYEMHTI